MEAKTTFRVPSGQRQLFLDDFGIADLERIERTMHQPEKRGAVLKPDIPSDGRRLQSFAGPMWVQEEGVYKMIYAAHPKNRDECGMALAISEDGVRWEKPNLGQNIEVLGSTDNNRFEFGPNMDNNERRLLQVLYDPDDDDPSRRYKGFLGSSGRQPVVSPDCLCWRKLDLPKLPSGDAGTLGFDRNKRLFLAMLKTSNQYGRAYNISISKDFEQWSEPSFCFGADAEDQAMSEQIIRNRLEDPGLANPLYVDPKLATGYRHPGDKEYVRTWCAECYNLGVFPYGNLYIGMAMMFYPTGVCLPERNNTDGFDQIQLVMSRNLKEWKRLGDRQPFISTSRTDQGLAGVWDRMQLGVTDHPVEREDELLFYYTGDKWRNYIYEFNPDGSKRDPETLTAEEKADFEEGWGAICLAVLRKDGFISLDAGERKGTILTEPFKVPGRKMFVNLHAPEGELRIEVLDDRGKVLTVSVPIQGDVLRGEVRWQKGNMADHNRKIVSIRFTLRNAAIYSYWLEED